MDELIAIAIKGPYLGAILELIDKGGIPGVSYKNFTKEILDLFNLKQSPNIDNLDFQELVNMTVVDAEALRVLALLIEKKDYGMALCLFQLAALAGDTLSMRVMARTYYDRLDANALFWYKKAGDSYSCHQLANMYHNGIIVPMDTCMTLVWVKQEIAQGALNLTSTEKVLMCDWLAKDVYDEEILWYKKELS